MFGRSTSPAPEDPSVAPAEAILDRIAARVTVDGERPVVEHALWICACVSMDDAPVWLIYDEPDGTLRWSRMPDGSEADDLVDARFMAGGHTDPDAVLAWLRGEEPDPWAGGVGQGDDMVARTLGRALGSR